MPLQPTRNVTGTTVIDLPAALERIGGDRQLFRELSLIFVEDSPPLLESLRVNLADRNRREAEKCAHGLKGIAANVGGVRVERMAVVVEDAARAGQLEIADIGFQTLSTELAHLIDELRAMLVSSDERQQLETAGE
jgi:HPt (histidine-containing phosphotransfer) domain-containing protein